MATLSLFRLKPTVLHYPLYGLAELWGGSPKLGDHYSTHQSNCFVRYLGGSRSNPKT